MQQASPMPQAWGVQGQPSTSQPLQPAVYDQASAYAQTYPGTSLGGGGGGGTLLPPILTSSSAYSPGPPRNSWLSSSVENMRISGAAALQTNAGGGFMVSSSPLFTRASGVTAVSALMPHATALNARKHKRSGGR
jgi:hypothetical protein